MYKVVIVSPGGVKRDFHGGFVTWIDAADFIHKNNGEYCDENGFVWAFGIEEEIDMVARLVIPNKEWCKNFLEFRQHGDDQALHYLSDVMENTFDRGRRLRYIGIRYLVDSLLMLNHIIALMESDEMPENPVITNAYIDLMCELTAIANKSEV